MGKLQMVTANMTCEKVLNMMKKFGVDQVPVVTNNGCVNKLLKIFQCKLHKIYKF